MIRTLQDIAKSEPFRADLARVMAEPTLVTTLQVLANENMPERQVSMVPGMSAEQAIAWDYSFRCGVQAVIKRLQQLPYLSLKTIDQAAAVGRPWEYLLPDEVIEAAQEQEKEESTGRKRITKPKSSK